jgi:hypothetical protein
MSLALRIPGALFSALLEHAPTSVPHDDHSHRGKLHVVFDGLASRVAASDGHRIGIVWPERAKTASDDLVRAESHSAKKAKGPPETALPAFGPACLSTSRKAVVVGVPIVLARQMAKLAGAKGSVEIRHEDGAVSLVAHSKSLLPSARYRHLSVEERVSGSPTVIVPNTELGWRPYEEFLLSEPHIFEAKSGEGTANMNPVYFAEAMELCGRAGEASSSQAATFRFPPTSLSPFVLTDEKATCLVAIMPMRMG